MNQGGIIAVSIVGALLLIGIFVLLYFTVFKHARQKKQCRDLSGRFEKSHAILFGQDSQFIKRLETISSMNLTYVDDYMEWSKRFKDIRDVSDASAQASINGIQDYLSERKYKELQVAYPSFKKTIDDYEGQVMNLDSSLKRKFMDEEECRQLSYDEREKLRKVKQDFFVKQNDLSLVAPSFEKVFRKMDNLFDKVEQNIENAQYSVAKSILRNEIAPVNEEIARSLSNLPNICISIQSVIPDKLSSLNNRYQEMINDGYPLHHILGKSNLAELDKTLATLAQRVESFDFKGVDKALDAMIHDIDAYMKAFDYEKSSRATFEAECDGIYRDETALESKNINLCHGLPEIKKIYILGPEEQAKVDAIPNIVNKAGASKRSLDTYIHSATKQPYSILVEKMHTLRDQSKEAASAIADFQNYLISLKKDSESAALSLPIYYQKTKDAETELRHINLDPVFSLYDASITDLYSKLDALYLALSSTPIDVAMVNKDLSGIKESGDALFAAISKTKQEMDQAEKEMVTVNRKRGSSAEVNSLLTQAEGLFFQGQFQSAFETALTASRHSRENN
jgi:septation ring formation regulator EzrA